MLKYYYAIFIAIFILLQGNNIKAQVGFQKTYGTPAYEFSTTILSTDSNKSVYMAGTLSTDSFFIEIIKIDSCLNKVFAKKIYEKGNESIGTQLSGIGLMKQDNHGNILLACKTGRFSPGYSDVLLISINPQGLLNWSKVYSYYHISACLAMDIDKTTGNIYMVCTGYGNVGHIVIKADSLGNLVWSKQYSSAIGPACRQLIVTNDGGLIVIGVNNIGGNSFINKYDSSGKFIWCDYLKTNDTIKSFNIVSNCAVLNNNIIVSGNTPDYGNREGYLLSVNMYNGNINWQKSYNWNNKSAWLEAIIVNENNTLSVSGMSSSAYQMGFLLNTDSFGNALWAKQYGKRQNIIKSLTTAPENGSYLAGFMQDKKGNSDFQLIKVDSMGKTACDYEDLNVVTNNRNWILDTTVKIYDSVANVVADTITLNVVDLPINERTLCTTQEPFAGIGAGIGNDTLRICDTNTYTIYNSNANPNSQYYWSTGDTTRSITVTQTGMYILRVVKGSCESVDSVYIIIAPLPKVLPINDTTMCYGDTLVLQPLTKQTAYPVTFKWSNGDTTAYTSIKNTGTYIYAHINTGGCAYTDTFKVKYWNRYSLSITPTDITICKNKDILYTANVLGGDTNKYIYKWAVNNTILSTNKSFLYKNIDSSQQLISTLQNTCGVLYDTSNIQVKKPLVYSFVKDTTVCTGDTVYLLNIDTGGFAKSYRYYWVNGVDTGYSLYILPTKSGLYRVNFIDICTGSTVSLNTNISIINFATFTLGADTTACGKYNIQTGITGGSFLWSTGDTANNIWATQSGQYSVKVYNTSCSATDTINIIIKPIPFLAAALNTYICPRTSIILDCGNYTDSVIWSNGTDSPAITVSDSGIYTVTAYKNGCIASTQNHINWLAVKIPTIQSLDNCFDEQPEINLDGGPYKNYLWQPQGDTLRFKKIYKGDKYTLTVSDFNDCKITTPFTIRDWCPPKIWIPNTFTPNAPRDTFNSIFIPVGSYIQTFTMDIYNRWGELMFHSDDFKNGWDGTCRNKPASEDIYLYIIIYGGEYKGNKFEETKIGDVLLLR